MSRKDWLEYVVSVDDAGMSVEQIVRQKLNVSGRMLQRLTRSKGILLNRKPPFLKREVKAGDQIAVRVMEKITDANQSSLHKIPPKNRGNIGLKPVDILYEDDHLLIANKPAGMMVHPLKPEHQDTLVHALTALLLQRGESATIHPVHRLDKDTSGVILIAKSSYGHQLADRLLRAGDIQREYLAVVEGSLSEDKGTIHAPISRDPRHPTKRRVSENGEVAITHYEVVQRSEDHTLVRVWLETGRTHQIRVHFQHLGHPLVGDTLYEGSRQGMRRQALHASRLRFDHPLTGQTVQAEAPLPADLKRLQHTYFSQERSQD